MHHQHSSSSSSRGTLPHQPHQPHLIPHTQRLLTASSSCSSSASSSAEPVRTLPLSFQPMPPPVPLHVAASLLDNISSSVYAPSAGFGNLMMAKAESLPDEELDPSGSPSSLAERNSPLSASSKGFSKGNRNSLKQEEILNKLHELDREFEEAKSKHYLPPVSAQYQNFVAEKEKLEKELRRLQMNQLRQQRFREKKRQREREIQEKLQALSKDDGSLVPLNSLSIPEVAGSNPGASVESSVSSPVPKCLAQFTQEQWNHLEKQFPVLISCPMIGIESMEPNSQQIQQSELVFLERIAKITSGENPQLIVQDIGVLVNVRQIFLKDCLRFGHVSARTFLYLMVACNLHLSDQEKINMITQM